MTKVVTLIADEEQARELCVQFCIYRTEPEHYPVEYIFLDAPVVPKLSVPKLAIVYVFRCNIFTGFCNMGNG
jgi:hypothetical protein